jgi:hypothetical protein
VPGDLPFVVWGRGCACLPRITTGCTSPVLSTDAGGQPSQERASENVGTTTWSVSGQSPGLGVDGRDLRYCLPGRHLRWQGGSRSVVGAANCQNQSVVKLNGSLCLPIALDAQAQMQRWALGCGLSLRRVVFRWTLEAKRRLAPLVSANCEVSPNLLPQLFGCRGNPRSITPFLPFTTTQFRCSASLFLLVLHFAMLSRRVLVASRFLRAPRAPQLRYPFPVVQQFRSYADQVVKVPEMAESISEGTLKQWSKQIGDYVELDEEIATIETDKASCSLRCRRCLGDDA